jgi:hypothetical protein
MRFGKKVGIVKLSLEGQKSNLACLADLSTNQLSPSNTMISLVCTSRPGIKAFFVNGITTW